MPSTPEVNRIKVAGSAYAKTFLARKYRQEYVELYQAYLINRGVTPRQASNVELIDEREILKEKEGN